MSNGTLSGKFAAALLLALILGGCATTYVPISWNFGQQVQQLSRSDLTLAILFNRYDPARSTLRVTAESFNEVMLPSEVRYHLGAYRQDTRLIYRNLYHDYSESDLRDLMVHEFAHHIWFTFMSPEQREEWQEHLSRNPTPLQGMVRRVYRHPSDYETEDFAFTVEYAREVDIRELARLQLITPGEGDAISAELKLALRPWLQVEDGVVPSAPCPELSKADRRPPYKGNDSGP
jgi:hypothetical protein